MSAAHQMQLIVAKAGCRAGASRRASASLVARPLFPVARCVSSGTSSFERTCRSLRSRAGLRSIKEARRRAAALHFGTGSVQEAAR